MASCLGWGSSVWEYGWNHCFYSLSGTRIGVSLFIFLLWAPTLLQDLALSLNPNSFVHISIFVHLCEAFLGIEPHFDLFRHLFHLKPQPSSTRLDVVGGAGIQLRQRMDRVYIPYKLSQKVIDWKPRWFYVENHGNSLPPILAGPPVHRTEWLKKPFDMSQIPELLEMIASLKQKGISGEAVAFDWMKRRIQPLQAPVTSFEYQGKNDPSRCSEEEISNGEALRRVQRLFDKV